MTETLKNTPEQKLEEHLSPEYHELHEQLEQKRSHESKQPSQEKDVEKTTHEALREAREVRPENSNENNSQPERRNRPLNRKELDRAFDAEMSAARLHMSPVGRSFSKIIHNKTVEKVSDVAGSTIARPNALLSGSVAAFIVVLGVYLTAKYFGYALSGSETMLAFLLGWIIGLVYDYIRITIRGKAA